MIDLSKWPKSKLPAEYRKNPFLTPAHAAKILGVRVDTLWLWGEEGKIPFLSLPSAGARSERRYRHSDVMALYARRKAASMRGWK